MSEYITLLGAEGVEKAGHQMRAAADTMSTAVSHIQDALYRHQAFMDEWLERYAALLEREAQAGRKGKE